MRPALALLVLLFADPGAPLPRQPKVAPGPNEPDLVVVLRDRYGLAMFADLANPVRTTPEATPGLFRKAGPGPVVYRPLIGLGLETTTRGGWYTPGPALDKPVLHPLWSYTFKNTTADLASEKNLPPPLAPSSKTEFDPGDAPFGLTIANDGLKDGGAFTQPRIVAAVNARLAKQPYKAMIYPYRDKTTGKLVPHSYLIGWEYSTNDDFQDVMARVDNVDLVDAPAAAPASR